MRKILIISASLGLGGSEKCMAEMIRNMDLSKYEVSMLALFENRNELQFPADVKVKNGIQEFRIFVAPTKVFLLQKTNYLHPVRIIKKILFSLYSRVSKKHISGAGWKLFSSYIPSMMESYDAVIGYGQGMATYYAIDKVPNAKRRILWLNTDLEKAHYDIDYIRRFYDKADAIFTDSMNGKRNAVRLFPSCAEKVHCFRNMMNTDRIRALANESCEMAADIHKPTIVTVGRIVEAKAMHLAAEAAAHLKAKGFSFRWVIVGDGNERPFLEKSITTHQVEDCVFLVGAKRNPYPWFKLCDIYVQTSIYEGSCMTINEAQVLGKPVVSTNFPAAYEKIEEGKSGYLVDMNGEAIAVGIEKLLSNKAKLSEMEEFVKHNCSDYTEQLDQLYKEFEMEA